MPRYYPDEVIKPILDDLLKVEGIAPTSPNGKEILLQGEWQLAFEDALWRAGKKGIELSQQIWARVLAVDPVFENRYNMGVAARSTSLRELVPA
jgi:LDH2 family malate/lactate/ureidoglycolate dehydrogenase